jgi:hypothetical protein
MSQPVRSLDFAGFWGWLVMVLWSGARVSDGRRRVRERRAEQFYLGDPGKYWRPAAAGHRPPLKLHVRFSRMQFSRRCLL